MSISTRHQVLYYPLRGNDRPGAIGEQTGRAPGARSGFTPHGAMLDNLEGKDEMVPTLGIRPRLTLQKGRPDYVCDKDRGASLPSARSGLTLCGVMPDQVWERGKRSSSLDTNLLDEDWREVQPHQRIPVNADHLESLLEASAYGKTKSGYLVDGFRQGFRLRLDRSIHLLVRDRTANARWVGGNKTALANPKGGGGKA